MLQDGGGEGDSDMSRRATLENEGAIEIKRNGTRCNSKGESKSGHTRYNRTPRRDLRLVKEESRGLAITDVPYQRHHHRSPPALGRVGASALPYSSMIASLTFLILLLVSLLHPRPFLIA